jgi:hypothetical protein
LVSLKLLLRSAVIDFGQLCSMADDILVTTSRNESRQLSLMSAIPVNSGTAVYPL